MTLAVDASVIAELLLGTERGALATQSILHHSLVAPQHLTVEVASVFRGWALGGHITAEHAQLALQEFLLLDIELLPMEHLLSEVFQLRHNFSANDAMYVVLARRLNCELLTLDTRLTTAAPDCAVHPSRG